MNYVDVKNELTKIGDNLQSLGISKGDRISVFFEKPVDYCNSYVWNMENRSSILSD